MSPAVPIPTPFHPRTSALCTSHRWKDWAGYHAVCHYGDGHLPEYFALRNAAGLLDVTPLFKYRVEGPDSTEFLSYVMTRNVRKLKVGRVGYTTWCNEHGKLLDDGTVMHLGENRYRVTSADPSFGWLLEQAERFDVELEDQSETLGALAVQGPCSREVLLQCAGSDVAELRYFGVMDARLDGVPVEVSRTGFTGDLGYEIWCPADEATRVWDAVVEAGRDFSLQPAGLDALDMTRVEAGFVLNGVDYFSAHHCLIEAQKSTPYELDLGWTVHLDRAPFVGQQALRAERAAGSRFAFVGLDVDWESLESLFDSFGLPPQLPAGAWRDGRPLYSGRRQVGRATSGSWSPTLKKNLALATIDTAFSSVGMVVDLEVTVEYERRRVPARVVNKPFFDPPRKRA